MARFATALLQSPDVRHMAELLEHPGRCVALLAPSFVVDFDYRTIAGALKDLGFDMVSEITFGAKMISEKYHSIIRDTTHAHISSACPTIVSLVKKKYPELIPSLVPVISPMVAMGKIIKKNDPEAVTVFIGPCAAKKSEAKESDAIDHALTFKELHELCAAGGILPNTEDGQSKTGFDSFYNDYTKIYPLAGGLSDSMHYHNILSRSQVLIEDDLKQVMNHLSAASANTHDPQIRFFDILACKGGCIGGPGIATTDTLDRRHDRVKAYRSQARHSQVGGTRVGLNKYVKNLDFSRTFTP